MEMSAEKRADLKEMCLRSGINESVFRTWDGARIVSYSGSAQFVWQGLEITATGVRSGGKRKAYDGHIEIDIVGQEGGILA